MRRWWQPLTGAVGRPVRLVTYFGDTHSITVGIRTLTLRLRSSPQIRALWGRGTRLPSAHGRAVGISPIREFGRGHALARVKTPSNVSLAVGLGAVRITWIAAVVVCALAIITALVSGTNGRGHSPAFPGFSFSGGTDQADAQTFPELDSFRQAASHTAVRGREAAKTAANGKSPALRKGRGLPTDKQALDKSRSGVRAPRAPSSQPDRTGGRDPATGGGGPSTGGGGSSTGGRAPSTPKAPSAPQAPSLPKPAAPQLPSANVPSPSLPQTESPSQTPQVSPQPTVSVSTPAVQTPVANVPSVTVALP